MYAHWIFGKKSNCGAWQHPDAASAEIFPLHSDIILCQDWWKPQPSILPPQHPFTHNLIHHMRCNCGFVNNSEATSPKNPHNLANLPSRFFKITKMSVQNITANCSLLAARRDFAGYVQQLNSTTGFNITLLEACKGDICNALWGDGNADISGIGVRSSEASYA